MQAIFTCSILGLLALYVGLRGTRGSERALLGAAFVAHVLSTFAIVAYYVYGEGGDMVGYAFFGEQLAQMLRVDPGHFGPEIVKLALHFDCDLPPVLAYDTPVPVALAPSPTVTMFALSGLAMYAVGDSLHGAAMLFSFFSYAGLAHLYKSMRSAFEEEERMPMLLAIHFVPSLLFWCSAIIKEAVVLGGFGFFAGSMYTLLKHRRLRSALPVVGGVTAIAMVKPYVLFPLTLAGGAWLISAGKRQLSSSVKVAAVLVAVGGLVGLSKVFPEFGIARLGESVAAVQQTNLNLRLGGSFVEVGDGDQRSLVGQLEYVSVALVNSLARPFLFEARNASMLLAGLETTAIVLGMADLIRRFGVAALYRRVRGRPPLFAAAVFVLSFGSAVGLATSNLGTLSRYRVPMMPMYVAVFLCLRASLRAERAARLAREGPSARGRRPPHRKASVRSA